MATESAKDLVSVREAARLCGRNPETVRRWIWSGKLAASKLGNQLFVEKSRLPTNCRSASQTGEKIEVPKTDFLERAIAFRKELKEKGFKPTDAAELIRTVREERMRELQ